MSQIHKRFTDDHVKALFEKYLKKEIEGNYIQTILGIKRRRFFELIKKFKKNPEHFTVKYKRRKGTRKISKKAEEVILRELFIDKKIILDKDIITKSYNYSFIKRRLRDKYNEKVSLPTIIDRAKKNDFYIPRKKKRKIHDREVLTNYPGELIQHDASHHIWAPDSKEKWYLITSLDDYSRFILYAKLVRKETSFSHIRAIESVILKYGFPHSYYVDCHSIFRFVQGRDSFWRKHHKLTDEATPQWKQVLEDCDIDVIYALSPQAKGKIERPYKWLQDNLVRICYRENVRNIKDGQLVLNSEVRRYNYRQVHSMTKEVPYFRFINAIKEKRSLFREFKVMQPFKSPKDIFCFRAKRTADAYRKISFMTLKLKVNKVNPRDEVTLRIYPLKNGLSEIRFWKKNDLIDIQNIKNSEFKNIKF